MRVLGLFVGVDHQLDQENIRSLNFAANDAEALWATFADMNEQLGSGAPADTVLLTGEAATTSNVREALAELATRSLQADYDLAVIHFSCHGVPSGQLVLYDTLRGAEADTGISLAEVTELASSMVVQRTVIALDTCFSGAAAGRRHVAGDSSLATELAMMAGPNRAVVWAAAASEQAWESSRFAHGLLTKGLLVGLDGTTLAQAGEVSIPDWIEHAVKRAADYALAEGIVQTPGRAGAWDGTPTIPALPVGPRRGLQLARRHKHVVAPDVRSLAVYGLSDAMLTAVSSSIRGQPLTPMQVRAISVAGAMAGENVLVSAPTSSGKTLVGELAALAGVSRRRKAVFLLPTRALAAEKWLEFRDTFAPAGIRAVRSFGGVDDDDLAIATNHFDVAFLTYEKFFALALTRRSVVETVGTVVLDEVHLLGDRSRGHIVELLLTLLRDRQRKGQQLQIVALSAALGSMNGFPDWLGATPVSEEPSERPVPLREGVLSASGVFKYRDSDSGEESTLELFFPPVPSREDEERSANAALERIAVAAAAARLSDSVAERVLAFRAHKPDTRRLAQALAATLPLERCDAPIAVIVPEGASHDSSRATNALLKCLEHGVAFHVADLDQTEREAVEGAFRRGQLRCLVSTSGLAMGINTPASTVLIVDHERFDGVAMASLPYSVSEYKNMAGRAGRWLNGSVERGLSCLLATTDVQATELFEAYVRGTPEPLTSQLGEITREDLVVALIAIRGGGVAERDLVELARSTFDGFQHASDEGWRRALKVEIEAAVTTLLSDGFLERVGDRGALQLTEIGRVCGREGLAIGSARRVLRAAAVVRAAGEALDGMAIVCLAQITIELDGIYSYARDTEAGNWTPVVRKLLGARPALFSILYDSDSHAYAPRLKRVFAVIFWLAGTPMQKIEERFTNWYPRGEPIAGIVRAIATRTSDLVRPIARLLSVEYPEQHVTLQNLILELRPRLEVGVSREATELAAKGVKLSRGERLSLTEAGITTLGELTSALEEQDYRVMSVFGSSRAGAVLANLAQTASTRTSAAADQAQRELFDDIAAVNEV